MATKSNQAMGGPAWSHRQFAAPISHLTVPPSGSAGRNHGAVNGPENGPRSEGRKKGGGAARGTHCCCWLCCWRRIVRLVGKRFIHWPCRWIWNIFGPDQRTWLFSSVQSDGIRSTGSTLTVTRIVSSAVPFHWPRFG